MISQTVANHYAPPNVRLGRQRGPFRFRTVPNHDVATDLSGNGTSRMVGNAASVRSTQSLIPSRTIPDAHQPAGGMQRAARPG
jgi:hypothetical protein